MDIGHRIQSLRTKAGMSQEALAETLGVSRQSVSKWELGQAHPDTHKTVALATLFGVTTDMLLLGKQPTMKNRQKLHFGMYLIVSDFAKSVDFYEKLLTMRATSITPNIFAQFQFEGICFSLMNQTSKALSKDNHDEKFVLNFWIRDLAQERERVLSLNIGTTSEIIRVHEGYYFFNLIDPDGNTIEITGNYKEDS
ncbi:MAG: helix-turn-helix domain-containing protein [Oscillospiraceae bacterium]|nr:helix-turn-helix domain-containing protein [Oscillospiraceae bacterium]